MVLDELLAPISADAPCGDDLEYDAAFGAMERAAAGKPEQQMGNQVVEAEEPDWRDVKKRALELFARTKDLRVATYLTQALLHTEQLSGFRDGIALIRGLIETYWESVHPCLDPDDDNDPTLRINTILTLCDPATTLAALRNVPLVQSRAAGRFGLRDIQIAHGEYPAVAGESAPQAGTIDAAFMDCELEELQATARTLTELIEHVTAIETLVTDQVGVTNAPSLDELLRILRACDQILQQQLERRGVGGASSDDEIAADSSGPATTGASADAPNGSPRRLTGEIHSREDVIRALDKVCEYYERHEPSSPLPLLIRRAKRLASKSFLEIIRDLAPDALNQAQSIGGLSEETEPSQAAETTSNSGW
jgi:type VI secretion system protein ImpA